MRGVVGAVVRSAAAAQRRTTTILCVRKGDTVVMMGDGQVTLGDKYVVKEGCKKLRRAGDDVIVGFAGSTADAMTLLEKLEGKLTEYPGQLLRACVELAKDWRGDKYMRQLNASMLVANDTESLEIDGHGNVLSPEKDGILAAGSGGLFAKAAARALIDVEGLDAEEVCRKAITIGVSFDCHSNTNFTTDKITKGEIKEKPTAELKAAPKAELKITEKTPEEAAAEEEKKQEGDKTDEKKEEKDASTPEPTASTA